MGPGAIFGIALWSLIPGFIAKNKGRSFWLYYFLGFIITPLITTIITLCLSKQGLENNPTIPESSHEATKPTPPVISQDAVTSMIDSSLLAADALRQSLNYQFAFTALKDEFFSGDFAPADLRDRVKVKHIIGQALKRCRNLGLSIPAAFYETLNPTFVTNKYYIKYVDKLECEVNYIAMVEKDGEKLYYTSEFYAQNRSFGLCMDDGNRRGILDAQTNDLTSLLAAIGVNAVPFPSVPETSPAVEQPLKEATVVTTLPVKEAKPVAISSTPSDQSGSIKDEQDPDSFESLVAKAEVMYKQECKQTGKVPQRPQATTPLKQLFCRKCGCKLAEGASFCHKCGAKIHFEQ